MDPSQVRKRTPAEIEREALAVLEGFYKGHIDSPVDIDQIVEQHERVGDIVPAELLEDKFNVAAVLVPREKGIVDIFVDEDTYNFHSARANFSIAHEFGHLILHSGVWDGLSNLDIDQAVVIHKKIQTRYNQLESKANYFAGAILMPSPTIKGHVEGLYEGLVRQWGFEKDIIPGKIWSLIARQYQVSPIPAKIRIEKLGLLKKIHDAIGYQSVYLEP